MKILKNQQTKQGVQMQIINNVLVSDAPSNSLQMEKTVHEMRKIFMPIGAISTKLRRLKPFGGGSQKYDAAVKSIERAEKDLVASFNMMEKDIDELLKKEMNV